MEQKHVLPAEIERESMRIIAEELSLAAVQNAEGLSMHLRPAHMDFVAVQTRPRQRTG